MKPNDQYSKLGTLDSLANGASVGTLPNRFKVNSEFVTFFSFLVVLHFAMLFHFHVLGV